MFDILNLIVAAAGVFIAVWAYRKSRLADEANQRYQEVQKQLAELQLIAAQRANIILVFQSEPRIRYSQSTVNLSEFIPIEYKIFRLLVKNIGNAPANNVEIAFKPLPDYSLPLGLEEPISISILASGIDISLSFSLVYGNAHDLNGSWGWENPNGTTETRESYLVIPI